jgi:hypothetical protein
MFKIHPPTKFSILSFSGSLTIAFKQKEKYRIHPVAMFSLYFV